MPAAAQTAPAATRRFHPGQTDSMEGVAAVTNLQKSLDRHAQRLFRRLAWRRRCGGCRHGAGGHSRQAGGLIHRDPMVIFQPRPILDKLHLKAVLQGREGGCTGPVKPGGRAGRRIDGRGPGMVGKAVAKAWRPQQRAGTFARAVGGRSAAFGHARRQGGRSRLEPVFLSGRQRGGRRGARHAHEDGKRHAARQRGQGRPTQACTPPATCRQQVELLGVPVLIIQHPMHPTKGGTLPLLYVCVCWC